ncbi:MAG: hypothetical protein COW19_10865 [Zetaproteobacteria bacterium CG12_big_fil_rev_8_21_14_0_65_55_1124]|nr:MAG: hypothetical protein AUJ58_02070 [Zetaproteobacteria bacterium CG1_02_55_237]PIS19016.1 MAG: hypothetical protein COT53_07900 [Zetaproteobacteria bacterium CG08_land_8_20_14_0_20_55_17]PIW41936.1 MAG: hypothetical protein COW19_10865 [Zetaproteobacteria bacterium CG12_big_fil_rev_8_21_14_0_65_55_1124]PIY53554.1 MAG: hypothetical protein COZ01_03410 [Zetaproteobacteria bacterium CG_4_10_14_0_8_um_filter_55_43]PIZ37424.1 MAG: hypothetical protein COY36_09255 [Zetaproteobacteria bacterium 
MKRTDINFTIDMIAFIGFVVMTITGVLMRYVLPPGSGHYSTIWGLDRHEWGDIHFWISLVFFSLLALHLVLHWRWLVSVVTGKPREGSGFRAGLGIVGLVAVIALALSLFLTPVEKDLTSNGASSRSGHVYEDGEIRGSMTLRDIAAASGVPAAYIVESLKLPESTSVDEQLGSLKRKHRFEMADVRIIVEKYNDGKAR